VGWDRGEVARLEEQLDYYYCCCCCCCCCCCYYYYIDGSYI